MVIAVHSGSTAMVDALEEMELSVFDAHMVRLIACVCLFKCVQV